MTASMYMKNALISIFSPLDQEDECDHKIAEYIVGARDELPGFNIERENGECKIDRCLKHERDDEQAQVNIVPGIIQESGYGNYRR